MIDGNIILAGMMCSGKSTIGAVLAKMLRRPFVDIDRAIVENNGKSIADIFASGSEQLFRQMENRELRRALKTGRQVIATGGGIVCTADNIRTMRAAGNAVCYLRAPLAVLAKRAAADSTRRPLLTADGDDIATIRKTVESIFTERQPLYERAAHFVVDVAHHRNRNVNAVAREIVKLPNLQNCG